MLRSSQRRLLSCTLTLCGLLLLSGCAASFDVAPSAGTPSAGQGFRGTVHGGQGPIAGSAIYMFAASTSGYGTVNQSLLKTTAAGVLTDGDGLGYVQTDALGAFTITADYTCPADDMVYLVAVGGNPGVMGVSNNVAIKEMTTVTACSALTSSSYLEINEVTTVASVTAVSGFMEPLTDFVSTSSANVKGLAHAFVTASNLVDMSSGLANVTTASGLGAVPGARFTRWRMH